MGNTDQITINKTTLSLEDWVKRIVANGERTLKKLSGLTSGADLLFEGKFGDLGTRWDAEKDGDLGEQIQQSMTMLTTFYAMKEYFKIPEKELNSWLLSAGDKNGPDLYNNEQGIICEVFAAKTPTQNEKLYKDLNALAKKSGDINDRYVFCCSPKDIPTREKFDLKIIKNLTIKRKWFNSFKTYTAAWGENNEYSATIVHITPRTLCRWVREILG